MTNLDQTTQLPARTILLVHNNEVQSFHAITRELKRSDFVSNPEFRTGTIETYQRKNANVIFAANAKDAERFLHVQDDLRKGLAAIIIDSGTGHNDDIKFVAHPGLTYESQPLIYWIGDKGIQEDRTFRDWMSAQAKVEVVTGIPSRLRLLTHEDLVTVITTLANSNPYAGNKPSRGPRKNSSPSRGPNKPPQP